MAHGVPPWPPPIEAMKIRYRSQVGAFKSPYNNYLYRYRRPAASRWEFDVQFVPLDGLLARQWRAFFLEMQDKASSFYWSIYPKGLPQNYATGWDVGTPAWGATPLVKGANQTGTQLIVDGLTPGAAFQRGDLIAFENTEGYRELHVSRSGTTTADGTGTATFQLVPRIRGTIADNAPVYFDGNASDYTKRCACEVIVDPAQPFGFSIEDYRQGISVSLIEALTATETT